MDTIGPIITETLLDMPRSCSSPIFCQKGNSALRLLTWRTPNSVQNEDLDDSLPRIKGRWPLKAMFRAQRRCLYGETSVAFPSVFFAQPELL